MAISFNLDFDITEQYEKPLLTLCNPQRSQLDIMGMASNVVVKPTFNGVSELTFELPLLAPYYNKVKKNRLVKVENMGWFVIVGEDDNNDGGRKYKSVTCYSFEYTLNRFVANIADGTYQFWNPVEPEGTLLHSLVLKNTTWTIGYISPALYDKFRTFEITDMTLYAFLMGDVAEAYECIFDFDTENKVINAYSHDESIIKTNVMLSFDNLIKSMNIKSVDEEIITALDVQGDDTLDIHLVNPMGTSIIYDFSYVKDTEWMSQELIDSINIWEDTFNNQQPIYSNLLSTLKFKNSELIVLESNLTELENSYALLETIRTERIVQGVTDLSDITNQIKQNLIQQNNMNQNIVSKKNEISLLTAQLSDINSSLKFENNFTPSLLEELENFIIIGTYQNENFGVLESMTPVEEQELAQQLYEQGRNKLNELCKPSYTFSSSVIGYLFLKEYEIFSRQTQLGCTVNLEIDKDMWIEPVLLQVVIPYDDPTNYEMIFSDKIRLNTSDWQLSQLSNNNSKYSNKVSVSGLKWNVAANSASDFASYLSNPIDLTNQNIQNSDSQETVVNQWGIWNRQSLGNGTYAPEQMRVTSNTIVITDDEWNTFIKVLGRISNPYGGVDLFGLNAESIVGKLIVNNQVMIQNGINGRVYKEVIIRDAATGNNYAVLGTQI